MLEGYEEPFPQQAPRSPYSGSRSNSFDQRPIAASVPAATDRTPLLPGATFAEQTVAIPSGEPTGRRTRESARCLKRPRCLCSAAVAVVIVIVLIILTVRFAHGDNDDNDQIPKDFVRLSAIDSTIIQEIRLGQNHNFLGHPAQYYDSATCWLTKVAANQLSAAQKTARTLNMTLKVYDCYRPRTSSVSFYQWSQQATDNYMQREFYPNMSKADIFVYGYLHYRSSHSRGAGLDVTLVPLPVPPQESYRPGDTLRPCNAPADVRFRDNSIDMGTGIYCFDPLAQLVNSTNITVTAAQQHNRDLLVDVMQANGFVNDANLWWQFVLQNEPYPNTYFDFPVVA